MQIDFRPLKKWVFPHFTYEYQLKYTDGIRYFVDKGGRSSAKSWHKAKKFVKRSFNEDTDQIIFQKHLTGANKGTRKLITQTIRRLGLSEHFEIPKSNYTITNKLTGCVLEFAEFKDEDKIKGAEGFRHYWIDEADQCSLEAFQKIDDTLRTYDDTTGDFTFNPVSPFCWLKTKLIDNVVGDETCIREEYLYFFLSGYSATIDDYNKYVRNSDCKEVKKVLVGGLWIDKKRKTAVHHSTYLQNDKLPQNYMEKKELERVDNFSFWLVNDMGEFGSPEGLVFPNFEIREFDYSEFDIYEGVDWGDTHPFFYLKVAVSESEKIIYICEEIAGSRLDEKDLIPQIKKAMTNGMIYADSSEPKTIRRWKNDYSINIDKVNKKKMTVEEQIKVIKGYKIVSNPSCRLFNTQAYLYKYPDNGIKDTPLKINDDGYDCLRYALFPWLIPVAEYQGYRG